MPIPCIALSLLVLSSPQTAGGGYVTRDAFVGQTDYEGYGSALALLGDVDGDGVADFAVGAPTREVAGMAGAGAVEIRSGADGALIRTVTGDQPDLVLGKSLAALGDVDGDGVPDFASGVGRWGQPPRVDVRSGADGSRLLLFAPQSNSQDFGDALAGPGDVDGDGVPDVAVGDPSFPDPFGGAYGGRVTLHSGATGLVLWETSGVAGDHFGSSMAAVPDVDGDGVGDLLVGAIWAEPSGVGAWEGRADLVSGSTGAVLHSYAPGVANAWFGAAVCALGDVDGDGIADHAVSGTFASPPGLDEAGMVWVFSGASHTLLWTASGDFDFSDFGFALADAGDVDGDGLSDLLVGAPGRPTSGNFGGQAHLFSGADGGRLWNLVGPGWGSRFGASLLGLGDGDGDGWPEVVVGAPEAFGPPAADPGVVHWREFQPLLTGTGTDLSASLGGTAVLAIDFPSDWLEMPNSQSYRLLLSATGTGPTVLMDVLVPLTPDGFYADSLAGVHPSAFQNPQGPLDANGDATATVVLPAGSPSVWVGRSLWVAAAVLERVPWADHFIGVSRPVRLVVVP